MKTILLFGSPTCQPCKMVKEQLDKEGIAYEYVDVATDEGRDKAIEHQTMSTPTLIVLDENSAQVERTYGMASIEVARKHSGN